MEILHEAGVVGLGVADARLPGLGSARPLPEELGDAGVGVPTVDAPLGRRPAGALGEVAVLDQLRRGDVDAAEEPDPDERRRAEPSPQRSHAGRV